jgi:RimJ/RimL family protein N-acetyltransferase
MAWFFSADVGNYLGAAGGFLRSRPAEHTILLSAAETIRTKGPSAFGGSCLFGWWQAPDGAVAGAFLHTPPFPVVLTGMAAEVAAELAGLLAARDHQMSGVNADATAGGAFTSTWEQLTGNRARVRMRTRLYRLDTLRPPDPAALGHARVAGPADRGRVIAWCEAFHREAEPGPRGDLELMVDDRLSYGGFTVWEAAGQPVSLAGLSRPVAGQARVGPVYTPPGLRGRGYGGAVTWAVSRGALDAGITGVLLFTDLANPTSNALYQRLGYRPIADRAVWSLRGG